MVQAVTFSSSVSSAASMITLLSTPQSWHGMVTASMSRSTTRRSPDLSAPTLMTMSISRAPSKIARRVSYPLTSAVVAPSGNPTTEHTPNAAADKQPGRQPHPRGVDAHGREVKLRRLSAQFLDVLARRVRLEQCMVDHRRDARRRTTGGVQADARRTRVQDTAQPIGAAVVEHRVARAAG